MTTIRVAHLYPDYLNIYADRGNMAVLRRRAEWRGHELEITGLGMADSIVAGAHDLFYIGGGQDREQLLVAVPVQAFPAVASAPDSRCHQLHAGCGQRIRHEKRCPTHGPLDTGALVRGYEYARGQFLVLDESELERLRPAADRALFWNASPRLARSTPCCSPAAAAGASDPLRREGPPRETSSQVPSA